MELKKYDKLLGTKKNLDGSISVVRQSPFDKRKKHELFLVKNQFVGSGKWILKKLISMDTTRHDLVGQAQRHNMRIREQRGNRNMHQEIADFVVNGGDSIVL